METKILFIRHGQSIGNERALYLGHTDLDLSRLGYEQASICAEYFKDVLIDNIYSSDLIRAHNTANAHALLRGMKVNDDRNLREIFIGEWEGKPVSEIESHPVFKNVWRKTFGDCTPPGGECVQDACDRFMAASIEKAKMNPGKTILIAAHAAVIRSLFGRLYGFLPHELGEKLPFPKNASCSIAVFDGEALKPVIYSFAEYFDEKKPDLGAIDLVNLKPESYKNSARVSAFPLY